MMTREISKSTFLIATSVAPRADSIAEHDLTAWQIRRLEGFLYDVASESMKGMTVTIQ